MVQAENLLGTVRPLSATLWQHFKSVACLKATLAFQKKTSFRPDVYCGSRKDAKRKDVVDYAVKLGLSGFSLPGKPGFIAVEGETEVCYDYWKNLKSWGWKRIELRHEEKDFSGELCFEGKMQELHFLNPTSSRNNCIDYGRFREFLVERRLGSVFEVLFKGEFKEKSDEGTENGEI